MPAQSTDSRFRTIRSDKPFLIGLIWFTGIYALLSCLLVASASYIIWADLVAAITSEAIQQSLTLTFLTCTVTPILSVVFAIPIGYSLSRFKFSGRNLLCLDEALTGLDGDTHAEILQLLKSTIAQEAITPLHITHSQGEAKALSQDILLIEALISSK